MEFFLKKKPSNQFHLPYANIGNETQNECNLSKIIGYHSDEYKCYHPLGP
jgi:hypothetical protein